MQAPAHDLTAAYVRICGMGMLVIISYNLIGSIFRGLGDSVTPLITVAIACVVNIAGDLFLVAVLHMGAAGAAMQNLNQRRDVLRLLRNSANPAKVANFYWS